MGGLSSRISAPLALSSLLPLGFNQTNAVRMRSEHAVQQEPKKKKNGKKERGASKCHLKFSSRMIIFIKLVHH